MCDVLCLYYTHKHACIITVSELEFDLPGFISCGLPCY